MQTLTAVSRNLPKPEDDDAGNHLCDTSLPSIKLNTTGNEIVEFSLIKSRVVIYLYPMTGRPYEALSDGWDAIPGARACTPQSYSFRNHHLKLKTLNTAVYSLSTQNTQYQKEVANRLYLPFLLVSDNNLEFISALNIPTIDVDAMVLSKRVTLIVNSGIIEKVFFILYFHQTKTLIK
jgi:peroxiredoxin